MYTLWASGTIDRHSYRHWTSLPFHKPGSTQKLESTERDGYKLSYNNQLNKTVWGVAIYVDNTLELKIVEVMTQVVVNLLGSCTNTWREAVLAVLGKNDTFYK